jgi:hypothetical protein
MGEDRKSSAHGQNDAIDRAPRGRAFEDGEVKVIGAVFNPSRWQDLKRR